MIMVVKIKHMGKVEDFKVLKRTKDLVAFEENKIVEAIYKAMNAISQGKREDATKVGMRVVKSIRKEFEPRIAKKKKEGFPIAPEDYPSIEQIQNIVEEALMDEGFHAVAKAYILYREKHAEMRRRDLFKKRTSLKPYEYPELYEYVTAIRHSYWIHTEFNYTSDIQDFLTQVNQKEKTAIQNSMLAIAQIEVAVKTFWGDIYKKMPKPEIGAVGFTFAESEVRHMDAYSHLLEILGLNDEFKKIHEIPALSKRVAYLEQVIQKTRSDNHKEYAHAVLLFSLFIEHVSLFSQFLIILSFNKFRNLFKGISNAVEATSKEEQIHGQFGTDLINIIKKEHSEWFDDTYNQATINLCTEAYAAEEAIVDWILEKGELDFISKKTIMEFIKKRFNNSLNNIGMDSLFDVDEEEIKKTDWFDDEILATKHGDFFVKRSINYNKRNQSVTADDLF